MPATVAHLLGPDQGEVVQLLALGVRFMIDGEATGGAFSLVEHHSRPGRWAPPSTPTIARTSTPSCSRDVSGSTSARRSWR